MLSRGVRAAVPALGVMHGAAGARHACRSCLSLGAPLGSYPGASSLPAHPQPPEPRVSLEPKAWCYEGTSRAAAWLQPGKAALSVPCVCLEFSPHQPSVALSSVNLILPNLHSRFFFYWC